MSRIEGRDCILRSERVVTPDGVRAASVHVAGGRIERVADWDDVPQSNAVEDLGEAVLMPGLVDSHVHVNEPGRTHWEGFETATRAAAAGGVTTLVDMPLNSIPSTTDVEALREKREAARGSSRVDVGFWGGVVPGNADDLRPLHREGVLGFKCFRIDSGVEEFEEVGRDELERAMPLLSELGTVLLTHAELSGPIDAAADVWQREDPRSYTTYVASRPPAAELEAIEEMIELSGRHECRVHIVHLSAAEAVASIARSREEGVPVTVETCPHYLLFEAESIPAGDASYKCAPPIRGGDNRDRLWRALLDGTIDLVATDHSPSPPELKETDGGDLREAWGGVASLQLSLSATWTGAREREVPLQRLAEWMSLRPAQLAGIDDRKGSIESGKEADLVAWWPEETFEVDGASLEHRHPVTPYDEMELYGAVEKTWVRGECVHEEGSSRGEPRGRLLSHRKSAL